jgi:AbrB family looped-hinge helix DNA binding protein
VKVDKKSRIIIPKSLREKAKLKEGGYVKMRVDKKGVTIEPVEPVADKYFGAFKIEKWPEDIDQFAFEVTNKWWTQKAT